MFKMTKMSQEHMILVLVVALLFVFLLKQGQHRNEAWLENPFNKKNWKSGFDNPITHFLFPFSSGATLSYKANLQKQFPLNANGLPIVESRKDIQAMMHKKVPFAVNVPMQDIPGVKRVLGMIERGGHKQRSFVGGIPEAPYGYTHNMRMEPLFVLAIGAAAATVIIATGVCVSMIIASAQGRDMGVSTQPNGATHLQVGAGATVPAPVVKEDQATIVEAAIEAQKQGRPALAQDLAQVAQELPATNAGDAGAGAGAGAA